MMEQKHSRRKFIGGFLKSGALWVPMLWLPRKSIAQDNGYYLGAAAQPAAGGPSFTFVQKTHSTSDPESSSTTVSLTGVTAGNLIIIGAKSELVNSTISSVSDGSSTFSVATNTNHANNDLRWQFAYCLSSVASGSVTYTVNRSAGASGFFWTFAMEFSGGGTRAFDAENGASGTSTAVNSGNISTGAAVALVVGSYAHYSAATISSLQIGGSAAGGSEPTTPGASQSAMWYRILSSTMSNGAATGTLDASNDWVSRILSIKAT